MKLKNIIAPTLAAAVLFSGVFINKDPGGVGYAREEIIVYGNQGNSLN